MSAATERLEEVRRAAQLHDGNLLAALRDVTNETTNAMCRDLDLDPSLVRRCLGRRKGRKYTATRRELELGLGLPTYGLDALLDADDGNT